MATARGSQFEGVEDTVPNHPDLRLHPNGKYILHAAGNTLMHAYPATRDSEGSVVHPTDAKKKPVGSLTWFGGTPTEEDLQSPSNISPGKIYKAIVKPAHQRKGLATGMLGFAETSTPRPRSGTVGP